MQAMHLSSLIDSNLVFLQSELNDLHEIYEFMSRQITERYPLSESQEIIIDRLSQRSLDEGILFPTGVAIPHLHLDNFNDTVIAVLVPAKPIETKCGVIKMFVMVMNGTHDNTLYLKILRSLIKMSKDDKFYEKLLSQKSAKDFIDLLGTGDFAVKETVTVTDLMEPRTISIKKTDTIKDLGKLYNDYDINYVPVIGNDGKVIGEVVLMDYLMLGFPNYTKFIHTLNFLKSFEPFEKLIKMGSESVESIMRPMGVSITPQTSIYEALWVMNKHGRHEIPIIENGYVLGVICIRNIFRKVFRG